MSDLKSESRDRLRSTYTTIPSIHTSSQAVNAMGYTCICVQYGFIPDDSACHHFAMQQLIERHSMSYSQNDKISTDTCFAWIVVWLEAPIGRNPMCIPFNSRVLMQQAHLITKDDKGTTSICFARSKAASEISAAWHRATYCCNRRYCFIHFEYSLVDFN
jgi:hypothetical protein